MMWVECIGSSAKNRIVPSDRIEWFALSFGYLEKMRPAMVIHAGRLREIDPSMRELRSST